MSYRIDYQGVKKVRGAERRVSRVASLTALFFAAFLLLVNFCWPKGKQKLQELVIPQEAVAAFSALENFAQELECGADLTGALRDLQGRVHGN